MNILGIETSCDETCAAVVKDGRACLSSVVASQIDIHKIYGGVVPEIASRKHTEAISLVTTQALSEACLSMEDVDAVAVTAYPGLIGALLVGVNFAKSLAYSYQKPLVAVHHIRGHIAANYVAFPQLVPPFLSLVVSGGHSNLVLVSDYTDFKVLGGTRDDAAGECFDKVARVMGLSYPGGVMLDRLCAGGDDSKYHFPAPNVDGEPLNFSFSGLKTAAINLLHKTDQRGEEIDKPSFAASFSKTVAEALASRLFLAEERLHTGKIVLAGGVSANSVLRARVERECRGKGLSLFLPPLSLCGDNAAMIASQGFYEARAGRYADSSLNAEATKKL